jgi:hypothetical protein
MGDAEALPDILSEAGITVLDTVPTLLGLMTKDEGDGCPLEHHVVAGDAVEVVGRAQEVADVAVADDDLKDKAPDGVCPALTPDEVAAGTTGPAPDLRAVGLRTPRRRR